MPSIKIDSYIELAYKTALEANTYISDNNIPVIYFHDDSEDKVLPCIVVHAEPAEEQESVLGLWSNLVNIYSYTKPEDDLDRAIVEAMNDAVQDVVVNTTLDQLYTHAGSPTGVGFYRVWHIAGDHGFSNDGTENYHQCKFEIISEAGLP